MIQPTESPTARLADRPTQRAGHIGPDDNRFCGAAVFGELAATAASPVDLVARAFGLTDLTAADREVLRLIALSVTSPDPRVWPLKLTRTLAAYGSAPVAYFGAQLATVADRMGPGAATAAAESLAWLRARVGAEPTAAAVAAAVAVHDAERGVWAGFGVPLRPRDERLIAMYRMIADHPATRRPAWRLHLLLVDAMRARGVEPNIVIAVAALMTDLGVAPRRAGMLLGLLMSQNFAAHALEAADTDGPLLRELPAAALDDRTRPPRRSPAAEAAAAAGSRAQTARRSLAW